MDLRWASPITCVLALCATSGCVTVYQPLVGLQRPAAIDPKGTHFDGLRIELTCNRGDYLWEDEAQQLCSRASKLFTNQGAIVRSKVEGADNNPEDDDSDLFEGRVRTPANDDARAAGSDFDLRVDLTARELYDEKISITWIASIASLTLLPGMSEHRFTQDVTIRDPQGFLLASDTWQARFIRYFGIGVWGLNWILDKTLRNPADQITGGAAERDFSRDYYRQLTQIVFNAKTRRTLLGDASSR